MCEWGDLHGRGYFLQLIYVIQQLEAQLCLVDQGKAWKWADAQFDGAWSKVHDRLYTNIETDDLAIRDIEVEIYRKSILSLIEKYKSEKNVCSIQAFLKGIGCTVEKESKKTRLVRKYESIFDLSPVTRLIPGLEISKDVVPIIEEKVCGSSQKTKETISKRSTSSGSGKRYLK